MTLQPQLGGPVSEYTGLSTDSSGIFTVTATLADGNYYWRVKGPKYLATSGSMSVTSGSTNKVEMGLLRAGDCNNDNEVNISDFIVLKNSFGRAAGDPDYDPRADFNNDDLVSSIDVILQKVNFGQVGAPPIGADTP
jgi:hypothetical protein